MSAQTDNPSEGGSDAQGLAVDQVNTQATGDADATQVVQQAPLSPSHGPPDTQGNPGTNHGEIAPQAPQQQSPPIPLTDHGDNQGGHGGDADPSGIPTDDPALSSLLEELQKSGGAGKQKERSKTQTKGKTANGKADPKKQTKEILASGKIEKQKKDVTKLKPQKTITIKQEVDPDTQMNLEGEVRDNVNESNSGEPGSAHDIIMDTYESDTAGAPGQDSWNPINLDPEDIMPVQQLGQTSARLQDGKPIAWQKHNGANIQYLVQYGPRQARTYRFMAKSQCDEELRRENWENHLNAIENDHAKLCERKIEHTDMYQVKASHILALQAIAYKPDSEDNPSACLDPRKKRTKERFGLCKIKVRLMWNGQETTSWEMRSSLRRLFDNRKGTVDVQLHKLATLQEERYQKHLERGGNSPDRSVSPAGKTVLENITAELQDIQMPERSHRTRKSVTPGADYEKDRSASPPESPSTTAPSHAYNATYERRLARAEEATRKAQETSRKAENEVRELTAAVRALAAGLQMQRGTRLPEPRRHRSERRQQPERTQQSSRRRHRDMDSDRTEYSEEASQSDRSYYAEDFRRNDRKGHTEPPPVRRKEYRDKRR